jgi:hypothetical protein
LDPQTRFREAQFSTDVGDKNSIRAGVVDGECFDKVIIISSRHLHKVLKDYFEYPKI